MKKDGAKAAGALVLTGGEERTRSRRACQAVRNKILHTELAQRIETCFDEVPRLVEEGKAKVKVKQTIGGEPL